MEKTLVLLKPDAIKRKLVGEIIKRIEQKGLHIANAKMMTLTKEVLNEHYAHIAHLDIFSDLVAFMTSGPVMALIIEGDQAIAIVRTLMGKTRYTEALPGTIRGDFATGTAQNLIHGSDSTENAEIEIKRFFGEL